MAPSSPGVVAALPARTASFVRSSAVVPSLQAILAELVQNSLDAHARAIHCHVDLDTWTLRCDDSGHGIPHSDLAQLASRTRHLSSKLTGDDLTAVATYGFRGEALASIHDVAALDIRTRPLDSDGGGTWHLVLRDGQCLTFALSTVERTSPGTTVTVRDIFHKLPVRRRPLCKPAAQAGLLSTLRSTVASLALLHPHVAFSLADSTTSLSSLSSEPRTILNVGRSSEGLVGRWRQLWGRAGVEKVWEFDEQEELSVDGDERVRVRGFFSLTAAHTKAAQHVYVNSRHLAPSTSIVHKHLNALFAASSFARFAASHLSTPSASPGKKSGKSPRRSAERHPVFVIALEVPGRVVDVSLEPEKRVVEFEDPSRIERVVAQVAKRFLLLHGFLHVATAPPAATAAPPLVTGPPERPVADLARSGAVSSTARPRSAATVPQDAPSARRLALPAREASPPVAHPSHRTEDADDDTALQRWVDPRTHEVWLVDPRTGNSQRAPALVDGAGVGCDGCECAREGKVDRRALKRTREEGAGEGEELPEWLRRNLESWENPIFPSAPIARAIPSLPPLPIPGGTLPASFRTTKRPVSPALMPNKPTVTRSTVDAFFRSARPPAGLELPVLAPLGAPGGSTAASAPVTREQLAQADFVAQVDNKYLVARVPPIPASGSGAKATLLLIDQHAASERIRVERLYDATVGAVARGDRPPTVPARVGLVVSGPEYAALRDRWRGEFVRWGFEVDPSEGDNGEGGGGQGWDKVECRQLTLTTVPAAISLRLLSPREPHLAQELVRAYLAQLSEVGPAPAPAGGGTGGGGWVAMLRHAPRVLKDLLDSKACRGAVMFNDVLTPDQSRTLLAQLATTTFPGQCAHGRPSMVPVVRFSAAAPGSGGGAVDWARFDD